MWNLHRKTYEYMSGCPDAEEEACVSKEREMVRHEKDYIPCFLFDMSQSLPLNGI